jgi:prepilin-type N-terminal cleavage/methylation domain-containing protein
MRSRGFTIVELLVSVVVAGVALAGIYYYYSAVQGAMREQGRISQAQLEARLGMELIAADLQRAGFLATPNSVVDPSVTQQAPGSAALLRIQPIVFQDGTVGSVWQAGAASRTPLPNAAQNVNIAPDDVTLYGNYLNANEYKAHTINAAAGTVWLQPLLQFPDPTAATGGVVPLAAMTNGEFQQLFPTTAFLRIVNRNGIAQFTRITLVSGFPARTITVSPLPLQNGPGQTGGIDGFCDGCRVNVVNGVLYRIERRSDDPATDTDESMITDLVRYFVDQNGAPLPAAREVVVAYAVDFQVWFRACELGAGGAAATATINLNPNIPLDNVVVIAGAANPPNGGLAAQPELIRSAIVRVTVRTRTEDPKFTFAGRARTNPQERIKAFEVYPTAEGAAHVRSYTTEVEMPNIAFMSLGGC